MVEVLKVDCVISLPSFFGTTIILEYHLVDLLVGTSLMMPLLMLSFSLCFTLSKKWSGTGWEVDSVKACVELLMNVVRQTLHLRKQCAFYGILLSNVIESRDIFFAFWQIWFLPVCEPIWKDNQWIKFFYPLCLKILLINFFYWISSWDACYLLANAVVYISVYSHMCILFFSYCGSQ